jgi:uncharacterized protein (TIGR02271 family)
MADKNEEREVVAVFDDYATAQQVARELEANGIPSNAIQIQSNFKTGAAGYRESERPASEESGVAGFFRRLFGTDTSDDERGHYAEAVRRGRAVVAVTAQENQVEPVARIMNSFGATDIDRHAEFFRKSGYEGYNESAPTYSADEAAREREEFRGAQGSATSVPVIEEELQVGKRAVQRGGVRVHSRVVNQPVEEQINLREEHVRVERKPADRPVPAADMGRLRDQTVEVTETSEEPVISKRARVREEIVVGKETTERTETIRDNVRRTEVRVDPIEKTGSSGRDGSPAYKYGYSAASDPRYANRSWSDAEENLRTDYLRQNPDSKWDEVKSDVRYGWEKVTGKR